MREHWKSKDRECPPCQNCGEILYEEFWGGGGWVKTSKSTLLHHSERDCIARLKSALEDKNKIHVTKNPKRETMWQCSIGVLGDHGLPFGADQPMRQAVAEAFRKVMGKEPEFIFSGWGCELSDVQRQVVKERGPGVDGVHFAGFDKGGES